MRRQRPHASNAGVLSGWRAADAVFEPRWSWCRADAVRGMARAVTHGPSAATTWMMRRLTAFVCRRVRINCRTHSDEPICAYSVPRHAGVRLEPNRDSPPEGGHYVRPEC